MPRFDPPPMYPSSHGEMIVGDENGAPSRLPGGPEGAILAVNSVGDLSWTIANLASFYTRDEVLGILEGFLTSSQFDALFSVEHAADGTLVNVMRPNGPEVQAIWDELATKITSASLVPLQSAIDALQEQGLTVTISEEAPPSPSVGDLWVHEVASTPVPEAKGGGGAIFIAASNAPQDMKDRAQFVCDGVEDQVEINAALALGASVELSEGLFIIGTAGGTSTSFVPGSPILLRSGSRVTGQGVKTILKLADYQQKVGDTPTGGVPNIFTTIDWSGVGVNTGIYLASFLMDGNKTKKGDGTGTEFDNLNLTGTDDFTIFDVTSTNASAEGFDLDYCRYGNITSCVSYNNGGAGFHSSGGGGSPIKPIIDTSSMFITFTDCVSRGNGFNALRAGFELRGGADSGGCIVNGCQSIGDYIGFSAAAGGNPAIIANCVAASANQVGFSITSKKGWIKNSYARDCLQGGYSIGSDYTHLVGCTAMNNTGAGFRVKAGADYAFITGCYAIDEKATHTQTYGIIEEAGCVGNVITGNFAFGNLTAGYSTATATVANNY